jgi:Txe/YoeB family toxin of Txe-Axe toxin-antitoxin module
MANELINENRLAKMEQKIDNIIDDIKELSNDIKAHVQWEAEKYEKLDGKYSGKWVEKAIVSVGTALIIAILVAVIKFI